MEAGYGDEQLNSVGWVVEDMKDLDTDGTDGDSNSGAADETINVWGRDEDIIPGAAGEEISQPACTLLKLKVFPSVTTQSIGFEIVLYIIIFTI